MLNEELKMEHERLHYAVESIQDKKYIDQNDYLILSRLKKEKLKIKEQLVMN